MKINKKVLIPVFASALGLSVIGGLTGAVAWYQYNSKVNTSFIGTSVADTGVLQLGTMQKMVDEQNQPIDADNDGEQDETIVWGRDFNKAKAGHLIPVTFGALQKIEEDELDDQNQPTGNKIVRHVLPKVAYSYPESGCGEGYLPHEHIDFAGKDCSTPGWIKAEEGKDYADFEVYFRAVETNSADPTGYTQVERAVFMSDYIFRSVVEDKFAHEALRVYIEVNDGYDGTYILANNEYKDANDYDAPNFEYDADLDNRLNLYGPLNLDRSNEDEANPNANGNDVYHASLWNDDLKSYGNHPDNWPNEKKLLPKDNPEDPDEYEDIVIAGTPYRDGEEICYGNYGDKQATKAIDLMKQERKANGKMPDETEEEYKKMFFKTSKDDAVKVRIVIWLEGWERMTNDGSHSDESMSPEWNPKYSEGTDVQVALQFDTGIFRGSDLTPLQ